LIFILTIYNNETTTILLKKAVAMDKQFAFTIVVIVLFGILGFRVWLINRRNIYISEVMIGRPAAIQDFLYESERIFG
jgi:hypothetical protein